jgi:ABC-type maltose transport system permease subunit
MNALTGVGSRRSKLVYAGAVYVALIAMTAVFLFPLLWVIGLSLKTRLQVFATPPLFLWRPTLENYIGVLGQADFLQAFVNSLVISSGAVILSACRQRTLSHGSRSAAGLSCSFPCWSCACCRRSRCWCRCISCSASSA